MNGASQQCSIRALQLVPEKNCLCLISVIKTGAVYFLSNGTIMRRIIIITSATRNITSEIRFIPCMYFIHCVLGSSGFLFFIYRYSSTWRHIPMMFAFCKDTISTNSFIYCCYKHHKKNRYRNSGIFFCPLTIDKKFKIYIQRLKEKCRHCFSLVHHLYLQIMYCLSYPILTQE